LLSDVPSASRGHEFCFELASNTAHALALAAQQGVNQED